MATALPPKGEKSKMAEPVPGGKSKMKEPLPPKGGNSKTATALPPKGKNPKMALTPLPRMMAPLPSDKGITFSETLLKQLECPVCFEYCTPPIVQCINGHNLCSPCRVKLTQCPTCRGKISLVRNRFAEEISVTSYPCPNQGCHETVPLGAMLVHLRSCSHVGVKCFHASRSVDNPMLFVPCDWTGSPDRLLAHVKTAHPTGWHFGNDAVISYKLRKQHMLLIAAHGHMFWSLLRYDFTTLDLRGAVFAVAKVKPPTRFRFQYHFDSADCTIFKRGSIGDPGKPNESYNSTIFQGKRMLDQFVKEDRVVKCKLKVMKMK